jgi:hypothetical protein
MIGAEHGACRIGTGKGIAGSDETEDAADNSIIGGARMEIGLDELYREASSGEWRLAAFWLPPLFWRHLMADCGASLLETQDLLEVVHRYHLFLVSATRRPPGGEARTLPPARLRSCLSLRDPNGAEQHVLKTKLPPDMKALVTSLVTAVNEERSRPFIPLVFPALGPGELPPLFPRSRGVLQLIARPSSAEELTLRWSTVPAPLEPPRPRPRRVGDARRA